MTVLLAKVFLVFSLLFKYSCLLSLPTTPHYPSHPHFPPLTLSPFGFVHVSFIHVPDNPSSFPPIISSPLPSCYCQFILNVNVSGHILLACLSCWLGSTYNRWREVKRMSMKPLYRMIRLNLRLPLKNTFGRMVGIEARFQRYKEMSVIVERRWASLSNLRTQGPEGMACDVKHLWRQRGRGLQRERH